MPTPKADLDKYGYTVGCPQCRHFEEYGVSKPGGVHTATCRARLVEEMGKDAPGRARLEAYDTNVNRRTESSPNGRIIPTALDVC